VPHLSQHKDYRFRVPAGIEVMVRDGERDHREAGRSSGLTHDVHLLQTEVSRAGILQTQRDLGCPVPNIAAGAENPLLRDAKLPCSDGGDLFGIVSAPCIDIENFASDHLANWVVSINQAEPAQCKCESAIKSFDFFRLNLAFPDQPSDRHRTPSQARATFRIMEVSGRASEARKTTEVTATSVAKSTWGRRG
jgi:hypothetical protein